MTDTTKKILIIFDPSAGRARGQTAARQLSDILSQNNYSVIEAECRTEDIIQGLNQQPSVIAVIGGDGSVRRVIEQLQQRESRIPLAILPRGSGNVLAASLKLPADITTAATAIMAGRTLDVDLAVYNDQSYVVTVLAAGFLGHHSAKTPQKLKNYFGFNAYILSILLRPNLPKYDFHFWIDDQEYHASGHSLFIVNAASVWNLVPRRPMDLQDGLFELAVVSNKTFLSWPQVLYYYYWKHQPPKHLWVKSGSRFLLDTKGLGQINIDGDARSSGKDIVSLNVLPRLQPIIIANTYGPKG